MAVQEQAHPLRQERNRGAGQVAPRADFQRSRQYGPMIEDILAHLALIFILLVVLFPVLWVISLALDPRNIARPTSLRLIPPGASLDAFRRILTEPLPNNVGFWTMFRNSMVVSLGTSVVVTAFAVTAAYAFARFRFPGRKWGLFAFIAVQMLPGVATLAPLFVLLNSITVPGADDRLRATLLGLSIAYVSTALPFAIWNLKGYIDTLPTDLEQAAMVDGAGPNRAFIDVILPLILPALAVTMLLGFMAGWTEFILAWTFISDASRITLAMGLYSLQGEYSSQVPWSEFAAMSILITLPVVVVFFLLQRWFVSGLAIGAVKG
ncbi:MAG TPA: sugar ABC transporter permease [Thermomicrobiales bacterium]|nr:sugar ABC transporter permease [Thermomicrobiales bacterium]